MKDQDLVQKASANGMVISAISRLNEEQVQRLRRMFATTARPVATRAPDKPTASAAAPVESGRTVVRRRTPGLPPGAEPAVAAPMAAAPVAAASVAPAPARPAVVEAREPEFHEEVEATQFAPEPVEAPSEAPVAPLPAARVAAASASARASARASASPSPSASASPSAASAAPVAAPVAQTTAAPTGPAPLPANYQDNRPRLRKARVEDLTPPPELQLRVTPPTAAVARETVHHAEAPAPAFEPTAKPMAAEAAGMPAAATQAPVPQSLEQIGSAIQSGTAIGLTKVPRLIRTKMPEFLTNIPARPVPRPAPPAPAAQTAAPAAPSAPLDRGTRFGADRPPADDKGGRGRKLIYDRRRDTGPTAADGRARGKKRGKATKQVAPVVLAKQEKRHLRIEDTITVANLAHQMSVKAGEVIRKLFDLGIMATINHTLDLDTVELIAQDFGFTVENVGFDLESYLVKGAAGVPEEEGLTTRSPVVTVMGHVDHGKTSLLDAIRKTATAAREAGGITQHIGAYVAEVAGKGRVVFLDTPGHEAFTAMRARGAKATDVIVLVVAADDGVMPQTIEAINHAKAASVPIIVAVNKIDKPGADLEKVRRELADHGVQSEDWGGDTTFCEVSAKTGKGIDKLLEMLALQSDIMDLKANADTDARGLVIESRLEKGRGPVATLLVQHGTLKRGQIIVSGSQSCKVRAMLDDNGKNIDIAGPSTPVEVIGFDAVTSAGDEFYVVADEKKAKAIVDHRVEKQREKDQLKTSRRTLEDMLKPGDTAVQRDLNLIIKADVHGSAEALKAALSRIEHEEVKVRVLHSAVGGVTESDIHLASASGAVIIAFNVKPEAKGKRLADDLNVPIKQYSVIYDAIDDVTVLLEGMLTPIVEEVVLGHAEVRETFSVPKLGLIAGCSILDGVVQRGARMRLFREKVQQWEGEIASLRRFKDDVKEVAQGYECGIGLQGFAKINIGDRLECYELKKTARKLPTPASRPQASAHA